MTKSPETEYVQRLLQMNPLEQSTEIIAKRRDFLQPQDRASHILNEYDSFDERKDQTIKNINALRKCLWSLDSKSLAQQIKAINVSEFPDLAISMNRLKAIADRRNSFRKLKRHPHCFKEFYAQFCTLVAASPQKAIKLRAKYLSDFRQGATDPSYPRPKKFRRIANIIRREMPELYQLEKPWLSQILSKKKSGDLFGVQEGILAILALLVVLGAYVAVTKMF